MKAKILLFILKYNCEKQITRVLKQFTDEVCSYLSEIIIINNRSTDNGEDAGDAGLDSLAEKYFFLKEKVEARAEFACRLVIGHGDPCFANALYNKSTKT